MLGILVGFILSLNDILSFELTKSYYLKKEKIWLMLPMLLYSLQIPLLYYGLQTTSITVLNITWNLFSNILISLMGIFYFKEKINRLKIAAILLGISSLFLFSFETYLH
jgi:multidrug transporter EmrE-like cation transporter